MSPETEARMRAWAARTRAEIDAGKIACPGDGSDCREHVERFGHHVRHCTYAPAAAELYRIERELEAARADAIVIARGQ